MTRQFRDYAGNKQHAPADLETIVASLYDGAIVWSTDGPCKHLVRYCLEVTHCASAVQASAKLGECVRHFAECAGKLDDERPAIPEWHRLDDFTEAYVECMLWAEHYDDGTREDRPFDDTHDWNDIDDDGRREIITDCNAFQEEHADDIDGREKQAGHDFYLTRNGHGAGFWDGDWPELVGKRLTNASKSYGTQGLMIGDDGRAYVHN